MASLSNIRDKREISCQQYINVWLTMMSGHGTNSILLNKKKKKIGHPETCFLFERSHVQTKGKYFVSIEM